MLGGSLVIVGSPTEGEQVRAGEEAKLASPEALRLREESRTKFESFDAEQAGKADGEAFPGVVAGVAGGPPELPSGESITGYLADTVASADLGDGRRGLVESTAPMAVETSPGQRVPIDLGLFEVGGVFEPVTPAVGVRIPRRLGEGVQLGTLGVSLMPVGAEGSPLSGAVGASDGASVLYANTETDTDALVKPTVSGFEEDTLLRSVESPSQLFFRVGLPAGASLVRAPDGSEAVNIVTGGSVVAVVRAPSAVDAAGTPVPVSMTVNGDVLALAVASHVGEYQWPIMVDPTMTDIIYSPEAGYPTNWEFRTTHPEENRFGGRWTSEWGEREWEERAYADHGEGEFGGLFYTTAGASQIISASVEGIWNDLGYSVADFMVLETPKEPHTEAYHELPLNAKETGRPYGVCSPELKCAESVAGSASPENGNTAGYRQETTGPGPGKEGYAFSNLTQASVEITQEKGPEVEFNTGSEMILNTQTGEHVANVLYGSGGWLGPHSGAFEVRAKDPGVGIKHYRLVTGGWSDEKPFYWLKECKGIQCPAHVYQSYTYKAGMPNGEASFEAFAEDAFELYARIESQKIKVDGAPPHAIKVTGFRNGDELALKETQVKVEAEDGEGATSSSGVKSIKVSVDGHEVSGSAASCPKGPCSASTEFSLAGMSYASGQHSLVVTATDNANNVAQEEFMFTVHRASPVSVGPGAVDPNTGQLMLNASDVSLGGTSGVSRTYQSRDLTAGAEGPLGPQWAINLGGGEGLSVLGNGSAVLAASGGASTSFMRNEKGEFVSPPGDSNLKLEAKEAEPGKGIGEYVLTDTTAGTKTKFEQPSTAQDTTPEFASEFGTYNGQLKHPISDAVDSAGDAWVLSNESDLIEKYSPGGVLLASYGSQGTEEGEFMGPWGIAVDPRNGDVYVSDQGNNRVQELSPSGAFIKMFGWGVSDGKPEFEICTKECRLGIAGAGNGQFDVMAGVSVDSSGNVWVADYGNNRVQEFNEKGEYVQKFGSAGKEAGQFEGPTEVAFSGGHVYVTDYRNNRVQEFSTAGAHLGQFGEGGSESENGKFSGPYGIASDPRSGDLYVVDSGHHRVQEFTAAGAFLTKFGAPGSGAGQFTTPQGIAISAVGGIYVVDNGANAVDEWTRPLWLPTETGGPLAASATTYAYTVVEEEGKAIAQPKEALAPMPAGVSSCTPLVRGCRALTFKYDTTETTASGENESQWGNYKGHLEKVLFEAYNPASKKIEEPGVAVAEYRYDQKGRLRAEWDPRLEHPLKTVYGYDAEGHVTAVTPPGQESWTLTYGTIAGDSNSGRLLKVTRASASAGLWGGEVPHNSEAPKLSGSAVVAMRMTVSNGVWANSPVVYGYQWQDCNTAGGECKPILGATNPSYTVATSDVGHTLVAQVIAANGGGSVLAASARSGVVSSAATAAATYAGAFESGGPGSYEFQLATGVAVNEKGDFWVLNNYVGLDEEKMLYEFNEKEEFIRTAVAEGSGSGQLKRPTGIVVDAKGDVWVNDNGNGRTEIFNEKGEYEKTLAAHGYMVFSKGDVWIGGAAYNESAEVVKEVGGMVGGPEAIDAKGDFWVADSAGLYEYSEKGEEQKHVGSEGAGNGQFKEPRGVAIGAEGSVWVSDEGNDRVAEFNEKGEYVGKFGAEGHGKEQFGGAKAGWPMGLALDAKGNVYVTDNEWVEKWTPGVVEKHEEGTPQPGATIEYHVPVSGKGLPTLTKEEVEKWGQKDRSEREDNDPVEGIAIFAPDEPQGWPASDYARATIDYMNEKGLTVNVVAPGGGIATREYNEQNEVIRTLDADNRATALSEGCVSVSKKECRSAEASELLDTKTEYDPEGDEIVKVLGPEHKVKLSSGAEVQARSVTHDYYDEGAKEAEEKNHESYNLLTKTVSAALLSSGKEEDKRETVDSYTGPGNQELLGWKLRKPTAVTTEPKGLNLTHTTVYDPSTADVIETRTPEGATATYAGAFESGGPGSYEFQLATGVAVNEKGDFWVLNNYVGLDEEKMLYEFNEKEEFIRAAVAEGSGSGQLKRPTGIVVDGKGDVWVNDSGNGRTEIFNEKGEYQKTLTAHGYMVYWKGDVWIGGVAYSESAELVKEVKGMVGGPETIDAKGDFWVAVSAGLYEYNEKGEELKHVGSEGAGNGQFKEPHAVAVGAEGVVWVSDEGNARVEEFNEKGEYVGRFGGEGHGKEQFGGAKAGWPMGLALDAKGNVYVTDNEWVEKWTPPSTSGDPAAHDGKTIYYSAAANTEYPECGEHPEWANLSCETRPVAQPADKLPELPVTKLTYNMWDTVEKTTQKYGAVTREKTQTYDPAGRALTSEETSTVDTALPRVTNEYNEQTGALEKQSATIKGKTKTITSKYNTLGQLTEYTDAEGNVAKYVYEEGKDGRLLEMSDGKGEEAHSNQAYSYDPSTGFLTRLVDSAAGTFTASYDVEGRMLSESYPNGMTATYTDNPVGTPTGIEYVKTVDCASKCPETWFNDTEVASIYGETLQQTSTLAKETYAYDNVGRLLETQETPAGKGCKTRLYGYDEESNRTSQTTRESATETCASEGGTTETHTYDAGNRLTDSGIEYETFGNTTKLPAVDAGGNELTSKYYVDSQVESQKQNGETNNYTYDPAGRTMETVSEGKTASTVVPHYAGPGEALAWSSEGTEKWTRNIPGIDGTLDAIETSSGTTTLQLHDLQGDIAATAKDSESETKLLSTYNSTEFGVPQAGTTPPKYAWLGANGVASEPSFASGVSTQGGASYVPETGRPLQTGPIASPGAFPDGTSGIGVVEPNYLQSTSGVLAKIAIENEASREEAKAREALEDAEPPCGSCKGDGPGEGNCEVNCLTVIEEGEDEEEGHVLSEFDLSPTGDDAHVAGHIECAVGELKGLPHHSSHTPGFVNWVLGFACNGGAVMDLQMRLALFWEGEQVSETGYVPKGDTMFAKQSVQSTCISGWYTAWYSVSFIAPPGYVGRTSARGWSKASRYVTCP